MAISTPQFIHTYTLSGTSVLITQTYDLPHLSYDNGYEAQSNYTSVAIRMANGTTMWQTFPIYNADPNSIGAGVIYTFTLRWVQLTAAQLTTLRNVYRILSRIDGTDTNGSVTFRAPDGVVFAGVKRHPEQGPLNTPSYVSAATIYYRAELKITKDVA